MADPSLEPPGSGWLRMLAILDGQYDSARLHGGHARLTDRLLCRPRGAPLASVSRGEHALVCGAMEIFSARPCRLSALDGLRSMR